ncbi:MAG: hypothetical protein M1114_06015 [Candidatus Dependentiae bacterium]|nr:hypothetical protein [Candidatus Dependentiae bacterium]
MKLFLLQHYFFYTILLIVSIGQLNNVFSMDATKTKKDINSEMLSIFLEMRSTYNLLSKKDNTSKEYAKKILTNLIQKTKNNALNPIASKEDTKSCIDILEHILDKLIKICEQDGDIDAALAYIDKANLDFGTIGIEYMTVPLKYTLLFKHKTDNATRSQQFDAVHDEIKKLLAIKSALAIRVYGMGLIAEGNIKDGLYQLEQIPLDECNNLSLLQLYIGYTFGYDDTPPNAEKAALYYAALQDGLNKVDQAFDEVKQIKRIKSLKGVSNKMLDKSHFFIKGYLKLFGLGQKKDIAEGLQLIKQADDADDDIGIDINELFPQLEQIKKEYNDELAVTAANKERARKAAIDELLAEESTIPKKKSGKGKKRAAPSQIKKSPAASSSSSPEPAPSSFSDMLMLPATLSTFSIANELTPINWNNYFVPLFGNDDQSRITAISIPNKTFTIIDPKRNEELIVHASKMPTGTFKYLGRLDYDNRIAKRQNTDAAQTDYDHSFAHMLDYVIQYVGNLVPYLQLGKDPKETLHIPVTRVDLITKKEITGVAEYTFGKDFNALNKKSFTVVYHRLLRPDKQGSHKAIASSSNQK